jgi:hypothetical protein
MSQYRFPRSRLEAWPTHYPEAIEHFKRPLAERVWDVIFTVLVSAFLGVAGFYYLSSALA